MFKVTELKGYSHVFTMSDGKTLRILPRKTLEIRDEKVSEEMLRAEKLGYILLEKTTPVKNTKGGNK